MRLECRVLEFLQQNSDIQKLDTYFTCKKSPYRVLLPIKFTKELCRIIGIIHGDGNMSGGRIHITDKNFKYHKIINTLFQNTFGISLNLYHDKKRNSYYSHIKNSIIYRYLTEVLEIPKGAVRKNLKIPSFIKTLNLELQAEYIAGLFDAEGHIRIRQAEIDFSTSTEDIFQLISEFLTKIQIKFSTRIRHRRKNPEFEIFIYGKNNLQKFNNFIHLKHPAKLKRIKFFFPH